MDVKYLIGWMGYEGWSRNQAEGVWREKSEEGVEEMCEKKKRDKGGG